MEVILLEKVQNVGDVGEIANVKNGYARNFLIPQKKAMLATREAKAEVAKKRDQLAAEENQRLEEARARAEKTVREVTLFMLCGGEGQLYGSVSPAEISEALGKAGSEIEKSEIIQPEGPIKHTGEYSAEVVLHPEVSFTLSIRVEEDTADNPEIQDIPAPEFQADGDLDSDDSENPSSQD